MIYLNNENEKKKASITVLSDMHIFLCNHLLVLTFTKSKSYKLNFAQHLEVEIVSISVLIVNQRAQSSKQSLN